MLSRLATSSQSSLYFVSACGENYIRFLAPPLQNGPASLGSVLVKSGAV
jgi:hypothetical protein